MAKETNRVAEGLRKAMQAEMEGQHFYQMAAQSTADAKGREIFHALAAEEIEHFNFLKTHHDSIVSTGRVADISLSTPRELEGPHPIFSPEIRQRIGQAHYEMTALSIGIQLERGAVAFYQAEAEAAEDPDVKALHLELMNWERGHLNALEAQADTLKEEYWESVGFSPF